MKKPELLAPAGNYECFKTAIDCGADAVYLGVGNLNARAYANNFSFEEVFKAFDYAHLYDKKVYVTMNTLLLDREMQTVLEQIGQLYEHGVDALIIQDLGLFRLVRQNWPDLPIHASTQMSIHNWQGAELVREMGASRIVLARELSLEDIQDIRKKSSVELEVFVHGAMCVSVSGQCLHSSLLGGRSGNRGQCAQPCRLPYQMDEQQSYLLSMKDLCLLDQIAALSDLGVESLKIEGRMKGKNYVAAVTSAYRRAIDGELHNFQEEKQSLQQVFNRGSFSQGYLLSKESLVDEEYNGHRGVCVGRIEKQGAKLDYDLKQGDEICVELKEGAKIYKLDRDWRKGHQKLPIRGNVGDQIWRLHSQAQKEHIEKAIPEGLKRVVNMRFLAKKGEKTVLKLLSADQEVKIEGDIVQQAQKQGLTKEKVFAQLQKTGDTVFSLQECEIELGSDDLFLPNSAINALRRKGLETLEKEILHQFHREPKLFSLPTIGDKKTRKEKPLLYVQCANIAQAEAALGAGADVIDAQPRSWKRESLVQWASFAKENPCYLSIGPILQKNAMEGVEGILREIPKGCFLGGIAANLGQIDMMKNAFEKVRGDFNLNLCNIEAVQEVMGLGFERVTLSPELTLAQIRDIIRKEKKIELLVYGNLPSMNLRYCPFQQRNQGRCLKDCLAGKAIKDRKSEEFQILPIQYGQGDCLIQLFNAHCLDGLKFFDELKGFGAKIWRMLFSFEEKEQVKAEVERYRKALDDGEIELMKKGSGGHFARGFLKS